MFSYNSDQPIVPLAEDFTGYASTTPESSAQLSGASDTPNTFDVGTPFNYNTVDHLRMQSPFDPSVLDHQSFNLGQGFSSTLQNAITTKPNSSRSRVGKNQRKTSRTKPCSGCRRRKTKCVLPPNSRICMECSKRNMDCVFEMGIDEPSMPLVNTKRACDNCNHRQTACVIPTGSAACTECTSRYLPCKFSETENNNAKLRTTIPIRDYDNYQGPTIMKKTLSLQGPKSSKFLGPSSSFEKNLLTFDDQDEAAHAPGNSPSEELNREQLKLDNSSKLRKINDDVIFKIVNDNEEFINLAYAQVDEIERVVYPHGLTLLNLYFKQVHPLIPVISQPVFLEKYSRTHREFDPLLLCMVYLHALNWWHTDSSLAPHPKPNVEKLERLVLVLYSENLINLPPKFSTCQGLILLLHYSFKVADNDLFKPNDYWKKMSQLITICEELGLNYNSDDWNTIPSWERKVRKILTWTVIMLDKMFALMEFRPSRVSPDSWLLNELKSSDFQVEENEEVFIERIDGEKYVLNHGRLDKGDTAMPLFGNLIFVKLVHLSYYINDCLSEIYNLKSQKFDDFDTLLTKCDSLLANLSKWYTSLPVQIKDIRVISGIMSTASLNLSYYLLRFLIFRRILNSFIEAEGLTDEQYNNFKLVFKHINHTIQQFNNNFMSHLTSEHFQNTFFYQNTANAFINVAITHQLVMKISKEELYLDNEFTHEHSRAQYEKYISLLQSFAKESSDVVYALEHVLKFTSFA